jgi:hypothetical protein
MPSTFRSSPCQAVRTTSDGVKRQSQPFVSGCTQPRKFREFIKKLSGRKVKPTDLDDVPQEFEMNVEKMHTAWHHVEDGATLRAVIPAAVGANRDGALPSFAACPYVDEIGVRVVSGSATIVHICIAVLDGLDHRGRESKRFVVIVR